MTCARASLSSPTHARARTVVAAAAAACARTRVDNATTHVIARVISCAYDARARHAHTPDP